MHNNNSNSSNNDECRLIKSMYVTSYITTCCPLNRSDAKKLNDSKLLSNKVAGFRSLGSLDCNTRTGTGKLVA